MGTFCEAVRLSARLTHSQVCHARPDQASSGGLSVRETETPVTGPLTRAVHLPGHPTGSSQGSLSEGLNPCQSHGSVRPKPLEQES